MRVPKILEGRMFMGKTYSDTVTFNGTSWKLEVSWIDKYCLMEYESGKVARYRLVTQVVAKMRYESDSWGYGRTKSYVDWDWHGDWEYIPRADAVKYFGVELVRSLEAKVGVVVEEEEKEEEIPISSAAVAVEEKEVSIPKTSPKVEEVSAADTFAAAILKCFSGNKDRAINVLTEELNAPYGKDRRKDAIRKKVPGIGNTNAGDYFFTRSKASEVNELLEGAINCLVWEPKKSTAPKKEEPTPPIGGGLEALAHIWGARLK